MNQVNNHKSRVTSVQRKIARRRQILLRERKEYLLNIDKTRSLLTRFANWYHENYSAFETILDSFSSNIESDALVDIFNDMDAPWNSTETYVLLAYLDPEEYGFVTTEMLIRLASKIKMENNESIKDFNITYGNLPTPVRQNLVSVYARFAPSLAPESPLNLELSMDGERTIQNLSNRILNSVDIPAKEIYMKSDQYTEECLPESTKLGTLEEDGSIDLFYDYNLAFTDCPIINNYAYFIWRTIDRMIKL
ncbi:hypothetical protein FGIG_08412 [Fasciola gigantica]|uniref:Uncharacterized protein n=1 Tax=Fasciola gigantica TaxID=46835 RepID=A0A504YGA7_FASGI|nr:hypothetical protein FGIG_08412 [Fasciola gigantica]